MSRSRIAMTLAVAAAAAAAIGVAAAGLLRPATAEAQQPPHPEGAVTTRSGEVSIPIESVVLPHRLVVDAVNFRPIPVRTRNPIATEIRIRDTRGYLVRGAIVWTRGIPAGRIDGPLPERRTGVDGTAYYWLMPTARLPLVAGSVFTSFARARKANEPVIGGVSNRRLVGLRTTSRIAQPPSVPQAWIVAPQEFLTHQPSSPTGTEGIRQFRVLTVAQPVDLALYSCMTAELELGRVTFHDVDGNGLADGRGDTYAWMQAVQGQTLATGTRHIDNVAPDAQGVVTFDVNSDDVACTIPVVWADQNNNDQLDVNAQGHPLEPYAVGAILWQRPA